MEQYILFHSSIFNLQILSIHHTQSKHNNKFIQSTTYQSVYLYTTFPILSLRKDF